MCVLLLCLFASVEQMDRLFLELQLGPEECYQSLSRSIEAVDAIIHTYKDDSLGDMHVSPERGTVCFGSALHEWGFTIQQFADLYAKRFGVTRDKMTKRLWGDNFFGRESRKWSYTSTAKVGQISDRGFCIFVIAPIEALFRAVMLGNKEVYDVLFSKLHITIPEEYRDLTGKPLLKVAMQAWLPLKRSVLQMVCTQLPSPVVAQRYRVANLYTGPLDDPIANGIRSCDPTAPLCMAVFKMVPAWGSRSFYAFGRVFSGTIATGQTVRIQGPDYQAGKKVDLFVTKVTSIHLMTGHHVEDLPECPCGNLVGLLGLDSYLLQSGTVTDYADAHNVLLTPATSSSPLLHIGVDVVHARDLPQLMQRLRDLARSGQVQCSTAATGEHLVSGRSESQLERCADQLREDFSSSSSAPRLRIGRPFFSLRESIGDSSSRDCLSKSPNKMVRITMNAQTMSEEFAAAVEADSFQLSPDSTSLSHALAADSTEWSADDARGIWCFGCPPVGKANVLVDQTRGVTFIDEIKPSIVAAFNQATITGCLADEPMRAVRFNLVDIYCAVAFWGGNPRRSPAQIVPATRRVMYACQLASRPILMEPVYVVDIPCLPLGAVNEAHQAVRMHNGRVDSQHPTDTPLVNLTAYLPATDSFGFEALLRQKTNGQAIPKMHLSHWSAIDGDPLVAGSPAHRQLMATRERKGLAQTLPLFDDFHDRTT